jgi:hypothetical protein
MNEKQAKKIRQALRRVDRNTAAQLGIAALQHRPRLVPMWAWGRLVVLVFEKAVSH